MHSSNLHCVLSERNSAGVELHPNNQLHLLVLKQSRFFLSSIGHSSNPLLK